MLLNGSTLVRGCCIILCMFGCANAYSHVKDAKTDRYPGLLETSLIDFAATSVSNVEIFVSNNGVMGVNRTIPGLRGKEPAWPRGSDNMYVFGGGFWFATKKNVDGRQKQLTVPSYNFRSGNSWFTPGSVEDNDGALADEQHKRKYRVYRSSNFLRDGRPLESDEYTMWPLWYTQSHQTPGISGCRGTYIGDTTQRTISVYPKGPAVLSDEDVYTIYNDMDESRYEGAATRLRGFPIGLQVEQFIYSYSSETLRDALIIRYDITNISGDTLRDCWFAPIYDFDLRLRDIREGSGNDRGRFYAEDTTLHMAIQWTEGDQGEAGKGFGYVGAAFLETPAINGNGFLRKDKPAFEFEEQRGLQTYAELYRHDEGPASFDRDSLRYNWISAKTKENNGGAKDHIFFISTGPFSMAPGDTARIAIAIAFAMPAAGAEASGLTNDVAGLVRVVRTARHTYYREIIPAVVTPRSIASENSIAPPFPNPARDEIQLEFMLEQPGDARIELLSSIGSIVFDEMTRINGGRHIMTIRLTDLASGPYYVRVAIGGLTKTFPIVVLR